MAESSNSNMQLNIDFLNDDCLAHVFGYLTRKDKLKIERVSKRWNRVAKLSWRNCQIFDVNEYVPYKKVLNKKDKNNLTIYLINILKRSQKYLNKLSYEFCADDMIYKNFDFYHFFNELPKYCNNLTYLDITEFGGHLFNDENLKLIFRSNVKLESIFLHNLNLNGDALISLQANNIKRCSFIYCAFESKKYLHSFTSNLKNLEEFTAHVIKSEHIEVIIDGLFASECDNICILDLEMRSDNDDAFVKNLSLLLSKQKNISELRLHKIIIYKNLMINTPTKHLTKMNFHLPDIGSAKNFTDFIYLFEKLEDLTCYFENLCFEHLEKLIKYVNENIGIIEISFSEHSHDKEKKLNYFDRLKCLQTFEIYDNGNDDNKMIVDNVLEGLSKCINLENIVIDNCDFTNDGLKCISSLPNLKSLCVDNGNQLTDNEYIDFVKESLKLEELEFSYCKGITVNLIKQASKIKCDRGDSHILNIECSNCSIDLEEARVSYPLIFLRVTTSHN